MASTVRMSITVPRDLKARMDAVEESVNWSAVAARAYEQTLAGLITRRGVRQMEDVVARLRASKQKQASSIFQDGFAAGRRWAEGSAEAVELDRLDAIDAEVWDALVSNDATNAYSAGEQFVDIIRPESKGDRTAANDFWEEEGFGGALKARPLDPSFVRGFAEGAHLVWNEVKDKI